MRPRGGGGGEAGGGEAAGRWLRRGRARARPGGRERRREGDGEGAARATRSWIPPALARSLPCTLAPSLLLSQPPPTQAHPTHHPWRRDCWNLAARAVVFRQTLRAPSPALETGLESGVGARAGRAAEAGAAGARGGARSPPPGPAAPGGRWSAGGVAVGAGSPGGQPLRRRALVPNRSQPGRPGAPGPGPWSARCGPHLHGRLQGRHEPGEAA